jgi:hypothetical protein
VQDPERGGSRASILREYRLSPRVSGTDQFDLTQFVDSRRCSEDVFVRDIGPRYAQHFRHIQLGEALEPSRRLLESSATGDLDTGRITTLDTSLSIVEAMLDQSTGLARASLCVLLSRVVNLSVVAAGRIHFRFAQMMERCRAVRSLDVLDVDLVWGGHEEILSFATLTTLRHFEIHMGRDPTGSSYRKIGGVPPSFLPRTLPPTTQGSSRSLVVAGPSFDSPEWTYFPSIFASTLASLTLSFTSFDLHSLESLPSFPHLAHLSITQTSGLMPAGYHETVALLLGPFATAPLVVLELTYDNKPTRMSIQSNLGAIEAFSSTLKLFRYSCLPSTEPDLSSLARRRASIEPIVTAWKISQLETDEAMELGKKHGVKVEVNVIKMVEERRKTGMVTHSLES